MSEKELIEVTKKDVLKHYLASVLVYGLVLAFIILCPLYNQTVQNPIFNYITFFSLYYALYVIFAYPILLKLRPESVLNSRNITILGYIKRQLKKEKTDKRLEALSPDSSETQSILILFIKVFFGVYSVNLLFNEYYISIGYYFEFLKEMFTQGLNYGGVAGFWSGVVQYINDTSDVWLKIILMISTTVLAFSYITESSLFKNNIKYADSSILGLLSCLLCYYPVTLITNKLFPMYTEDLIPVPNLILRTTINIIVLIVSFISMIAIIRLGGRSGNLTNRGIVTGFPYNIVRHPDYAMQMVYVISLSIPVYYIPGLPFMGKFVLSAGTVFWIFLYYLRAITEERNLIKDEKYRKYIEKVPYRFIPKLF